MLAENFLLAAAGAALGWLLAGVFLEAVVRSSPDLPYWMAIAPDARLLLFTILLMSAVGLIVGIAPALRASSGSLLPDLQGQAPGSTEPVGAQRMQGLLVAGQVAASLALLVAAQLLIRNYLALQNADAGFDDSRMLSMRLYLPGDRYDPIPARAGFHRDALARIAGLPGVEAAASCSALPIDDGGSPARLIVEGGGAGTGDELGVSVLAIAGGFHETLGLNLEGRAFTAREQEPDGPPAAILGRALARRLFPSGGALGRRVGFVSERGTNWFPVVGIAPDVQFEEFGESTTTSTLNVFVPYALSAPRTMALLIRTSGDPAALTTAVLGAVRDVEPDAALYEIRTMRTVREETTWGQRFFGKALGGFAATALFLAGLGAWGLVAHSVARRHREIGIRLALGAEPRRVVRLFAGRALRAAGVGALIGLLLGLAAAALLRRTLFTVEAFDAGGFALAALLLVTVVALASILPARRAARVDPASTLRSE
jgi:predicted permease